MARLLVLLLSLLASSALRAADIPEQEVRTYDDNPRHLWNRVHQTLFVRVAPDGTTHGQDRLDPLFWGTTKHLLEGPSHRKALDVLDEFLRTNGEKLVRDPLRRAFLQHDLWALFDWAATPWRRGHEQERKDLQLRLAQAIRRLAFTDQDLSALPDNYARAVADNTPASLPKGLFDEGGDWVHLTVSPVTAPSHMHNFNGRSTFHVLLRLADGRAATLAYLERLRSFERPWIFAPTAFGETMSPQIVINPQLPLFPAGTEWALVRRMRVLDVNGNIRPTSIIESIQLRHYLTVAPQGGFASHEDMVKSRLAFMYVASRARQGEFRTVVEGERDFVQFQSHDTDPLEVNMEELAKWFPGQTDAFRMRMQFDVLRGCFTCHAGDNVFSVQSLARVTHDRLLHAPTLSASDPQETLREPVHSTSYQLGLLRGLWAR